MFFFPRVARQNRAAGFAMGVNALELEDLISEAEAWIDTIMKDTAISAQSLRDEAEVLPPPTARALPLCRLC